MIWECDHRPPELIRSMWVSRDLLKNFLTETREIAEEAHYDAWTAIRGADDAT